MNNVETPNKVNNRGSAWGQGISDSAPGNAKGAGGGNLKSGTQYGNGGSRLNRGRFNGGHEVSYDKQTMPDISKGSTSPSR